MKRIVLLVAMLAMLVVLVAPAALAQQPDIIPPPEQGTDHANSICSFSGINDNPNQAFPENGRVQSYGQLVRKGALDPTDKSMERPGVLCNAHNLPRSVWAEF
jgi:hypothetical protein